MCCLEQTVRRNAELEQRTKALEEELSTTSTHLVMMTDRVNRLTQEMNLLEKDLEDAEAQLDLKSAEVGSLVKQVAGHEKELSVVNQLLQEKGMQLESSIAKNVQDETQMANLKQDLTAIRVANAKANDLARDSLAVAKAARAEAETARAQLEHLEKTMGEEVTNLKMELNTAKEARDSAQTRADASEKQAYELNALLESAQAQVTELTSKVTELEGFVAAEAERREADREKVEAASAAVRKAREMRVQLDHAAAMYKDVTDKLTATSKERDDAVSIARTSESALLLSKQELEVALTQSDELRTKLTDKESTLEETKKQLEATSNELTETKAKLNKLELAHRPCDPTIAYLGNQVRYHLCKRTVSPMSLSRNRPKFVSSLFLVLYVYISSCFASPCSHGWSSFMPLSLTKHFLYTYRFESLKQNWLILLVERRLKCIYSASC